MKEIAPKIDNVSDDTELAGVEVYEIEGWKYGEWIGELAALREDVGEEIDEAGLTRALELAAIEPLTALDYHGRWLVDRAMPTGRGVAMVELFRAASEAEINPLFGKPKHYRILQALFRLIDSEHATPELRLAATRVALSDPDRVDEGMLFDLQGQLVVATRAVSGVDSAEALEAVEAFRDFLKGRIAAEERSFFVSLIERRNYTESQPDSTFLRTLLAVGDSEFVELIREGLRGDPGGRLVTGKRMFAARTMDASVSEPLGADWDKRVDLAFRESKSLESTADRIYWPTILGDALANRRDGAEAALRVRRIVFEDTVAADGGDRESWRELAMAGVALLKSARDDENVDLAGEVAAALRKAAKEERKGDDGVANAAAALTLEACEMLAEMGMRTTAVEVAGSAAGRVVNSDDLAAKYQDFLGRASD